MIRLRSLCPVVLVAALALFAAQPASAQYTEDGRYAGFHLGMSGVGSAAAFGVQGDIAYNDRISIGGWVDVWSYGESYTFSGSTTEWSTRYVSVAATGSYHFPIENNPKLDPFLGVSAGYFVVSSSATGSTGAIYTGDGSRMFVGGHAGVRYFFKPTMSGVARLGVGSSYLTLGMDFGL
jgi:hypothetical protein